MFQNRGLDQVWVLMVRLSSSNDRFSFKLPICCWVHFSKMYFSEGLTKELSKMGLPGGQSLS